MGGQTPKYMSDLVRNLPLTVTGCITRLIFSLADAETKKIVIMESIC